MFDAAKKYPELRNLREFTTAQDLVEAFRSGGTVYLCQSICGWPAWVAEREVRNMRKHNGAWVLVLKDPPGKDEILPAHQFLGATIDAAFRSAFKAREYFEVANARFHADNEWQHVAEQAMRRTGNGLRGAYRH